MITVLPNSRTIRIIAVILVMILSIGIVVYSLVLLTKGVTLTTFPESISGTPALPSNVEFIPDPAAIVPLLAAILIMAGTSTGKLQVAWLGIAALLIFSTLFVFGIGGPVFIPAVVLLTLMTVIQIVKRESSKSS